MVHHPLARAIALIVFCFALSCDRGQSANTSPDTVTAAPALTSPTETSPPVKAVEVERLHASASRIIAVGDVHGDLAALKLSLALAGLIDASDTWIGEETVLVQTGDLLDRGDDELEIMTFLYTLRDQARAASGDVVLLLGNHETMNARGDLRYVTPGGFEDFADTPLPQDAVRKQILERYPPDARGRMAAFLPGGEYARKLATHKTIAVVGTSVFVHGGVLPDHVDYGVDKINEEVQSWLLARGKLPEIMRGENSPLWSRHYSQQESKESCALLDETLQKLGVERMVVGHTPQAHGITSACDGKVWRIDVGMAAHYGGSPAALEIKGSEVRQLAQQEGAPAQK